jgi:hypothetical protein
MGLHIQRHQESVILLLYMGVPEGMDIDPKETQNSKNLSILIWP